MHETPKKRGCFFWGCLITGICGLTVVVILGVLAVKVRNAVTSLTDSEAKPVPVAEVSAGVAGEVRARAEAMVKALEQKTAGDFRFTAQDLNALIATVPEARELRGKALFTMEGDCLSVQASLPLEKIPGMSGRYLNDAKLVLELSCTDGKLVVHAREITVKGKPLPPSLRTPLQRVNLAEQFYSDPKAAAVLKQLEALEVRDGQLGVRTRGNP